MNKRIIISLFIIFIISLNFMFYIHFSKGNIEEKTMSNEQPTEIIILEENNEMEEIKDETISNDVESSESIISNDSSRDIVLAENNKKNDNSSSTNTIKKSNNSKVKEKKQKETSKEEIPVINEEKEQSTQIVDKTKEKEEEGETSKSVEVVIEIPDETSIENDPTYIRMKKELYSSISECNNKGMELNLKDMKNIASTMCSSESYKGVEVGFRLYIRYNDGTYKEYKK